MHFTITNTKDKLRITCAGKDNNAHHDEHDDQGIDAALLAHLVLQRVVLLALSALVFAVAQMAALRAVGALVHVLVLAIHTFAHIVLHLEWTRALLAHSGAIADVAVR